MKEIKIKCEVITPMFLAGADGRSAELRPPSLKGMMRFWWRAVKAEQDIKKLLEEESKIFGSSDEKYGKSKFSVKIEFDRLLISCDPLPRHQVEVRTSRRNYQINILDYLAYGLYERQRQEITYRSYLKPKTNFTIHILLRDEKIEKEILLSLYYLTAFGGLGSRTRNGFGSFIICNRNEIFKSLGSNYINNLVPTKDMLEEFHFKEEIPPYSAFSKHIKLFKTKNTFPTWDAALAEIGRIYKSCREQLETRHCFEKRQFISAPLDPKGETFRSFLDRRAKPYFMKIIKKSNKYIGYILYLPSLYCHGLKEDRNGKSINHDFVNQKFLEVCSEMNNFLAKSLDEEKYYEFKT